jgi:hypothetical protein
MVGDRRFAMNEPNEDFTDQPSDGPRSTDFTDEPPRGEDAYPPWQMPSPTKSIARRWMVLVCVGTLVFLILGIAVGVLISAMTKVTNAAQPRSMSMNNVRQMVIAVNNIGANSPTGAVPSSYGPFPPGSATQESFFVSLLPYIQQSNLYTNQRITTPVRTYIAPADPNNPGSSGLISYGSNATLLTVGGNPTLPGSFGGRPSNVIVVFERTALSGATWSNTSSYLTDIWGSSSPEFTGPASWSSYGTRATAFTSAGCIVGMGDGSVRVVNQSNANAGWAWAMDPTINKASVPNGW